jgi:hypothetical protein
VHFVPVLVSTGVIYQLGGRPRAELKTAPRRKRANSGGGGSKTGRVGQTMIREKMSQSYLFDNSILVAPIPLTHQAANALQEFLADVIVRGIVDDTRG